MHELAQLQRCKLIFNWSVIQVVMTACLKIIIYMYQLSCLISHIRCTRKVRKTNNDLIKTFILLLCTQYILLHYKWYKYLLCDQTSPCSHNNLHDQFLLFLVTVLTNKLFILIILFLQWRNWQHSKTVILIFSWLQEYHFPQCWLIFTSTSFVSSWSIILSSI